MCRTRISNWVCSRAVVQFSACTARERTGCLGGAKMPDPLRMMDRHDLDQFASDALGKAHAQSSLEASQSGHCFGFGEPSGVSQLGFIYQDVSQSPPALYCPKNGAWVACGGSGGGLASFTTGNLSPIFTAALCGA